MCRGAMYGFAETKGFRALCGRRSLSVGATLVVALSLYQRATGGHKTRPYRVVVLHSG